MPQELKDAYPKVSPDPIGLQTMFDRDVLRMLDFKDIKDDDIRSITVPTLILISDQDVATPEHAVEMDRLIPKSRLLILPGGHGKYMGEITFRKAGNALSGITVSLMETFLDAR